MSYENTNNVTMLLTHFHHHWKLIIVQLAKVVSCIRPLLPTAILSNSTLLVFRNHDIRRHHYITFNRINMINTIDLTFFPAGSPMITMGSIWSSLQPTCRSSVGKWTPNPLGACCTLYHWLLPISNNTIIIIIDNTIPYLGIIPKKYLFFGRFP